MITWIIGNSGAGKSHLARRLLTEHSVWLDGDDMRTVWHDLDMSKESRLEQNNRIARLAQIFDEQGLDVVISSICPYKEQRKQISEMMRVNWVHLPGGRTGKEYPFEKP